MKKLLFLLPLLIVLAWSSVQAATPLAKRLAGRLVLQVESVGEMWYIDPKTLKAVFVGSLNDIDRLKTEYAITVSDRDLARITLRNQKIVDSTYSRKMAGRLLLQSSNGKLWYVSPVDLRRYEVSSGIEGVRDLWRQAIGISQKNFAQLGQVGACTADLWSCGNWGVCQYTQTQQRTCTKVYDCPFANTPSPIASQVCAWTAPLCQSFEYSAWGECSDGHQYRYYTASPLYCQGGNPGPITRNCMSFLSNIVPQEDKVLIGWQATMPGQYLLEVWTEGNYDQKQSLAGNFEYYNYYYQKEIFLPLLAGADHYNYSLKLIDQYGNAVTKTGVFNSTTNNDLAGKVRYNIAFWDDGGIEKSCRSCVLFADENELYRVIWRLIAADEDNSYSLEELTNKSADGDMIVNNTPELANFHVLLPYENWTVSGQSEGFEESTYVEWLNLNTSGRYYWSAIIKNEIGEENLINWSTDRFIFYQTYNP